MMALALLAGCNEIVPPAAAQTTSPTLTYLTSAKPGKTTRYWDCCKASSAWPGKVAATAPVGTCAKDGKTLVDAKTQNGCDGGSGYMCNSQQPWAVNDSFAYGYATASLVGKTEADIGCACFELKFTNTAVAGKSLVVQAVNVAGSSSADRFDLLLPGGGVGIFNGCQSQFGAPADGWGARYGGISSASECAQLPADLRVGCNWRFTWFKNADNPEMTYRRVKCPVALTTASRCKRNVD